MKMKRYMLPLCLLMPSLLSAQTATWKMQPRDYDRITPLGKDLFQVMKGNKLGLIRADGTTVEDTQGDALSLFYEHKALLTCNDDHGTRILGVLSDRGIYTPFRQKYYTLTGQAFYSDGLLTVEDEQHRKGYVDENGVEVLGFDNRFDRIKPFTEGFAAVYKNKKFGLINKAGQKVTFRFETVGDIAGGANIYQGIAYLFDSNGRFYTYNVQQGGYCRSFHMPSKDYKLDYLSRFACISNQTKDIPYTASTYQGAPGPAPSAENGKYGWSADGKTVLPHQFVQATPFTDGLSIVRTASGTGILQYETGNFSLSAPQSPKEFEEGKSVTCSFALETPACWQRRLLTVTIRNEQGTVLTTATSGRTTSFRLTPSAGKRTFTVEVSGEGLQLYASSFTVNFVKIPMCPTCHKSVTHCAYKGKHPAIAPTQTVKKETKEKLCDTCHKPISQCPSQGVHY